MSERLEDIDLEDLVRWLDYEPPSLTVNLVRRALAELTERRAQDHA